jgi:hypothetical protein
VEDVTPKSTTERVKDLHDRRRAAKVCRKQRKTDAPHGPIHKSNLCAPCYREQLDYNNKLRRELRKKRRGGT